MRIASATLTNVKGLTAKLTLAPLTVITASDNHARKTAVVDGIKAGLLGYHPALGKRPAETFRLSSGESMTVTLCFDTGAHLTRSWKAGKRGAIGLESEGEAPPGMLAVLDTQAFIGANAKTRLAMLAHVATGAPLDTLKANFPKWAALLPGIVEGDPIDTAVEYRTAAETRAKIHKEGAARQAAAIATLAEKETSARLVTVDELNAASHAVANARNAAATARGHATAMEHAADAATDASEALAALGDLPTWTDYSDALAAAAEQDRRAREAFDAAEKEAAALLKEREGLTRLMGGYSGQPADSLGHRLDELDAYGPIAAIKADAQRLEAEAAAIDKQLAGISTAGSTAKKAILDASAKLVELDGLSACPFCKCSGEGWNAALRQTYEAALTAARNTAGSCESEWKALNAALKSKRAEAAALREKETELTVLPVLQQAFDAAQALTLIEPRIASANDFRESARLAWGNARGAIEDLTEKQREQQARQEDIARSGELKKIISAAPKSEDMEAAYEAVRNAEAALETVERSDTELQHEARRGTAAAAIRDQLAESRDGLNIAKESQARMDELKTAIALALELAVHDTYKPIIEGAKLFGAGVWEGDLCSIDNELGVMRGAQFVPFEILSGTEQAVITAAIQASLSNGGLVIIDELSRMTPNRKAAFAANLTRAVEAGTLTQAILIDYDKAVWREASNRNYKTIDLDAL